ncbi:MAG: class I SAM-dependent methyltransferase [Propylenella sp.]
MSRDRLDAPARVERPVSKTSYYCAGTRMLDAHRPDPLVNDAYAERFMGNEGKAVFEGFRHLSVPIGAHQVRCHLIDELVRERFLADRETLVVLIGAGFDSRAFRLKGGRWLEIDDQSVIARKEEVAPAVSCPNPLERIAIDFEREPLADKLAPYASDRIAVAVCEGLTMYLEPPEIEALAEALRANFPRHVLIADVMTRAFAERFGKKMSRALAAVGTGFRGIEDAPLDRLERLGYRRTYAQSLVARSLALKRVPIPSFVRHFLWMLPTLRDGYRVAALESAGVPK